tara:strand:- start:2698 stop:2877 length:180 start_codon:yes stop_codon:yes gene_type:complete
MAKTKTVEFRENYYSGVEGYRMFEKGETYELPADFKIPTLGVVVHESEDKPAPTKRAKE